MSPAQPRSPVSLTRHVISNKVLQYDLPEGRLATAQSGVPRVSVGVILFGLCSSL